MSPLVVRVLRHYTRVPPESLGLFRVLFGLGLIVDWKERWDNRVAFYSNEGVLPNHNHLYHLKGQGRFVWSAFHAFSTPGEAAVGLLLVLFFYLAFTIGWKTRAFHVLSLVGLVSLSARNTLAEGAGDALAITLLAVTAFLPLGTTFSLDGIVTTAKAMRETKPKHLDDASALPTGREIERGRLPGWAPWSLAAMGALGVISMVLAALGKQQTGQAWKDATALHDALHVYMIASPRGFALRDSGVLVPLTRMLSLTQWLVPLLVLIPVLRHWTRGAAALLLFAYGATYAGLTTYTLFGWCMMSASFLLVSHDTWDAWRANHDPKRALTVIYDVDCGICFWIVKLLRRLDTRRHLVFQGNGDFPPSSVSEDAESGDEPELPPLKVWDEAKKKIVPRPMPKGIVPPLVERTVVAVQPDGSFATRGAAVASIFMALPGFGILGVLLRVPGIAGVRDALYDAVATRRTAISIALGMNACGVVVAGKEVPLKDPIPPAKGVQNAITITAREVGALVLLVAIGSQNARANDLGKPIEGKTLNAITWWLRATERWDVLVPGPPETESELVVDAITKDGRKLDLMTGREPTMSFDRPYALGGMWARYLERVTKEENKSFQDYMRKYFARRGPRYQPPEGPPNQNQMLAGADGFWIVKPAKGADPGVAERLFRHSRGGAVLNADVSPLIKPPTPQQPGRPMKEPPPRSEPDMDIDENRQPPPPQNPESPGQEQQ